MEPKQNQTPQGLQVTDYLFILYRHWIKIVVCFVIGLLAAGTFYFLPKKNLYSAEAKLLIRYVIERSAYDPSSESLDSRLVRNHSESVIDAEMQILTSKDLALMVVDELGAERLGAADPDETAAAAGRINANLTVEQSGKQSDVILVSYQNQDPALAIEVLDQLIKAYMVKHIDIHRSTEQLVSLREDTNVARTALREIEDQLKEEKTKAGILSVEESMTSFRSQMAKVEEDLNTANAELAEQVARVNALQQSPGSLDTASQAPDRERVHEYQTLLDFLNDLRKRRLVYLSEYLPKSQLVTSIEEQIANTEDEIRGFERRFPGIVALGGAEGGTVSLFVEEAKLAAIKAKQAFLEGLLAEFKGRIGQMGETGYAIERLERTKAARENKLNMLESRLEEAEVDQKLKQMGTAEIPNIGVVQRPALTKRVLDGATKITLGLAGGGLALGIMLALLNDLFLDRTIRRPLQIERQLGALPIASLPMLGAGSVRLLPGGGRESKKSKKKGSRRKKGEGNGCQNGNALTVCPRVEDHLLKPYTDAIRDRLGYYFQINEITHKPKLIGVTAFSSGAGVSTLAAALAASCSEPGYGKVLLVDMNGDRATMHSFFEGHPVWSLPEALQSSAHPNGDDQANHLYLAKAESEQDDHKPLKAKEFYDLLPQLALSDFDFIVFDMPPIGSTSPTTAMAGFLDKTLLIVEAGETTQEDCKRGYDALATNRADVSLVLNKAPNTPSWLRDESFY